MAQAGAAPFVAPRSASLSIPGAGPLSPLQRSNLEPAGGASEELDAPTATLTEELAALLVRNKFPAHHAKNVAETLVAEGVTTPEQLFELQKLILALDGQWQSATLNAYKVPPSCLPFWFEMSGELARCPTRHASLPTRSPHSPARRPPPAAGTSAATGSNENQNGGGRTLKSRKIVNADGSISKGVTKMEAAESKYRDAVQKQLDDLPGVASVVPSKIIPTFLPVSLACSCLKSCMPDISALQVPTALTFLPHPLGAHLTPPPACPITPHACSSGTGF